MFKKFNRLHGTNLILISIQANNFLKRIKNIIEEI